MVVGDLIQHMKWIGYMMRSKQLVISANEIYFEKTIFINFIEKSENRDFNIWTNVNEVGSKNVIHSHKPDAYGIYYVQGEGTGNLMFTIQQIYYLIVIPNHHLQEKWNLNQKMEC